VVIRLVLFEMVLQKAVPSNSAVFITGTSTGFGRLFTLHLAKKGFTVFAGVRKEEDGKKLLSEGSFEGKEPNIIPVICDLTKQDQISAAARFVKDHLDNTGLQLYALVNNVGIQAPSPIEIIPMDVFRNIFEVNVFGGLAVTQAFIPLLRKCNGSRIVFISSITALTSSPFMGAYFATKQALEGYVDSLRVELLPWNIRVSLIEPGSFSTDIIGAFTSQEGSNQGLYNERYQKFLKVVLGVVKKLPKADAVAIQLEKVLLARFPPARALIGHDSFIQGFAAMLMPDSVVDFVFNTAFKFI